MSRSRIKQLEIIYSSTLIFQRVLPSQKSSLWIFPRPCNHFAQVLWKIYFLLRVSYLSSLTGLSFFLHILHKINFVKSYIPAMTRHATLSYVSFWDGNIICLNL